MVATRQFTIAEFAAMPLQGSWELIDGELIELTPTAGESGWIAGRLFSRLERFVDANGLGWAFPPETGFVLFGDRATVRSPDSAYVQRDRLERPAGSFVPVAPDLAAEVLSPSDRMTDALSKITMYLQAGVRLVWLIDPESRTVVVFRSDAAPATLRAGDVLDGGEVLPGFSVPVAEIFA